MDTEAQELISRSLNPFQYLHSIRSGDLKILETFCQRIFDDTTPTPIYELAQQVLQNGLLRKV